MNKIISVLVVFSMLICMTGCSGTTDIEKRAVVQIVGIDIENKKFEVSMQIFAPDGEMLEKKGGAKADVVTGTGNSIDFAIKEIEMKTGKEVFLGHNMLLFLGESTRNENINDLLEYFTQGEYVFPGLDIVMTNGKAFDFISLKLSTGLISSQTMEDILKISIENGNAKRAQLAKVVSDVRQIQKTAAIPIVDITKIAQDAKANEDVKASKDVKVNKDVKENSDSEDDKTQDTKVLSFSKTAVFKDNRYIMSLDKEQTMGLKWLTNEVKKSFLSIDVNGVPVGVSIEKAKTTLRPRIIGDKVVIDTQIKISASASGNLSLISKNSSDLESLIKKKIKNQIVSQCESTQEILLEKYKADVLDIEKLLRYYQRSFYLESRDDYEKVLQNTSYEISIKCDLKIHK